MSFDNATKNSNYKHTHDIFAHNLLETLKFVKLSGPLFYVITILG